MKGAGMKGAGMKGAGMKTVTRDGCAFEVFESGPADGEVVVLLHGFPQHADSWDKVVPLLTAQGYRTVTMNQRGYTPGALPPRRRDYLSPELVADAEALVDAYGGRAHVIGHDWGAVAAWGLALGVPEKVASLTAVSVPHPRSFLQAVLTSRQFFSSWYMLAFQIPWLPERALHAAWMPFMTKWGGMPTDVARRDLAGFPTPQSLTGPLNWYRAIPLANLWKASAGQVDRPVLFVWSDRDVALKRKCAENCGRYVTGPYQFEVLPGVSHWIPDEAPGELASLVVAHLRRHPARVAAGA